MVNRSRRVKEWFSTQQAFQDLADGGQTNLTLFSAALVGPRFIKGATVTRMLIDIALRADSVAQTARLFWGIVPMNADARAAGAFPDADDMSDRPGWMIRGQLTTIQASLSDSTQWDRRFLDIRSQRVLRNEEEELQLIVDNLSGGAVVGEWAAFIRVLMLMP